MNKDHRHEYTEQCSTLDRLLGIGKRNKILPVCDHYAATESAIVKSLALQSSMGPVFDISLDLEDGGGHGSESQNRELVRDALNSAENGYDRVGVRIHGLDTEHWQDDIDAIVGPAGKSPAYITIPKVTSDRTIEVVDSYIHDRAKANGSIKTVPLHVMVENMCGLMKVEKFASHPSVECISFGMLDFVSSFGGAIPETAMRSPGQFNHPLLREAKVRISLACHAHGIVPSHSLTLDFGNSEAVSQDAKLAREEFGYLRMWSIHPTQIEPILQAFRYENQELSEAVDILLQAKRKNWVPIKFQDSMHDLATYRMLWTKIRIALMQGSKLPDQVEKLLV